MTPTPGDIDVAMLIHNYLPVTGGAERQLAAVIPRLVEHGVNARVITSQPGGEPAHEVLGGVEVTRITTNSRLPAGASINFTRLALRDLRERPADIVHAHSLLSPSTTAVLAKRRLGTPAIAKVLRGGALSDLADLRRKGVGGARFRMINRGLDGFVVISDEIDEELATNGVANARRYRIPNGVDTDHYRSPTADERAIARAHHGLDGPTAVFTGRLAPEKAVDTLIRAWTAATAGLPNARLLIAGEGPEEERLRAMAPASVEFLGMVGAVAELLWAADVFVLASDAEGLSNAMLEAMATATPPIASAVGATPELVGRDRGWVVPPRDEAALATALHEALTDPDARLHRGDRAREFVEREYSLDRVATDLTSLYRQLLATGSTRR